MRALVLSSMLVLVACGDDALPDPPTSLVTDPVAVVDPTIGTGGLGFGHGACFVGAASPHGLVKLGPDTSGAFGTVNFLHYSGYYADDDTIRAFTHLHLHGAGATDYGVLGVMPTLAFDAGKPRAVDYSTRFAKSDEHAAPGLYRVTLANAIAVELAATPRVGVHRYTLPSAGALVIDLTQVLGDGVVDDHALALGGANGDELVGHLHAKGGMTGGYGGYTLYVVIRASAPIDATHATLTATGAALAVPAGATTLAVGVSLVSEAGARANLDAEVGATLDLDAIVANVQAAWRAQLGVVAITATARDARIFYTSLYHAFLMPTVIDDVDGTYQLIGQPARRATGYHQQSDMSLWDTYRTLVPLYGWLAPADARDTGRSLIGFGDGLGAYPRWPIAIGESGTMLGASAEIALADVVARGADVDPAAAYPLARAEALAATPPAGGRGERDAVDAYLTLGYVPSEHGRSVSTTTEYAHDDFALAHLADAAGAPADRDTLLARRHGWQQLYDPSVGFLRARSAAGAFEPGTFDPLAQLPDYAEANAWQSLWMVGIHDPDTLATTLGGRDAALAKLAMLFEQAKAARDSGADTGMLPPSYYWHGNEPDLDAAWLFTLWGDPASGQRWVRWVMDTMYSDLPDGVAGNDDGGTLGAWYVLAALGLYPIAGSDGWILGAPRFPAATVTVGGRTLTITTEGRGARVTALTIDGEAIDLATEPTIPHGRLTAATAIHVVLHD